ncbi:uncharacterized protein LOC135254242 isoform X2 [Anguilla rostrata]|uniref:uncharacterized protein LOC135254242 isoform X2 n=1 Tax=Anguilla rostrata TaxID=7938 RepID=UPI0030D3614C
MATLEKDTEKSKLPAKLKTKHAITLNSKERKILMEQRKNEEMKKVVEDVMTKLSKRSGQDEQPVQMKTSRDNYPRKLSEGMVSQSRGWMRNSLEFGPPSIGGSTEQMWTESTTGPQVALRKRRQSWSPSTFSTASTGQDSGITSHLGSLRSLTISEYPAESDAALPPGTGSR